MNASNSSTTSTKPKDEVAKSEDKMKERSNKTDEKEKPRKSSHYSDADSASKHTPELKENEHGVILSPSSKGRV